MASIGPATSQHESLLIRRQEVAILWERWHGWPRQETDEYGDTSLNDEDPVIRQSRAVIIRVRLALPPPGTITCSAFHLRDQRRKKSIDCPSNDSSRAEPHKSRQILRLGVVGAN